MRWPKYGFEPATELSRGDLALAFGVAAVTLGQAVVLSRQGGEPSLDALGAALILGQTIPLIWRRSHPLLVATTTAMCLAVFAVTDNPQPLQLGPLVAFAYLIVYLTPRVSAWIGAATVVGTLVVISLRSDSTASDYYLGLLLVGSTWLLGNSLRLRRAYLDALEERARRLEQSRKEEASRAVQAERRRIAREMHDVVSHYVSVMVLTAEAAAATNADPHETETLDAIARSGRDALTELRRLLGVLRDEPADVVLPSTGRAGLEELVAQVEKAGLPVHLEVSGDVERLSPGLERSAHRIVQGALTNALKHAAASHVAVRVHRTDSELDLEVADNGRGSCDGTAPGSGHGLIGLRERVLLCGGSFEAGPRPDGGFKVHARLPLEEETRA
jgi:signal transduction histidine kinase